MDRKTNGFSLERIFLLLIIGIGCLGLASAFQAKQEPSGTDITSAVLSIQGSFTVNAPIRFTLNRKQFSGEHLEIDFGNGTQRELKADRFTFAYQQEGEFILKIKQNNKVVYQTSIFITRGTLKEDDLLVMRESPTLESKKGW